MSHAYQQYKQRFGPKNLIFLGSAGLYFLSLFFDHPVKQNNPSNSNSSLLEYKTCSTFRIYSNLKLKRCKLDRCLYK